MLIVEWLLCRAGPFRESSKSFSSLERRCKMHLGSSTCLPEVTLRHSLLEQADRKRSKISEALESGLLYTRDSNGTPYTTIIDDMSMCRLEQDSLGLVSTVQPFATPGKYQSMSPDLVGSKLTESALGLSATANNLTTLNSLTVDIGHYLLNSRAFLRSFLTTSRSHTTASWTSDF